MAGFGRGPDANSARGDPATPRLLPGRVRQGAGEPAPRPASLWHGTGCWGPLHARYKSSPVPPSAPPPAKISGAGGAFFSLFWGERARSLDHPFLHGCVANLVSREGGGWGESMRGKGRKMSGRIQPANRGSLCRACVLLPSTSLRRRQTEGQTDRQTRPGGSRVSAVEVHGLLPMRVFIPPDDLSPIRPISIKRRLYTGLALSRWHTAAIEPKAPALLGSTSGTEGTDFKQGKDIKYLV